RGWRASWYVSLLAVFSGLGFLAALFVKLTVSYGAFVYAVVLLTGALVLARPFSATLIAFFSGVIYSLQSPLFLMIVGTFLARGFVLDLVFIPAGVYRDARAGRYNVWLITVGMAASSFAAGVYQYFFMTLFMRRLVDFGAFVVSTIFLVGLVSNVAAGYLVPKYIMPRLKGVLR
ncbi:MAG: hypothetical protein ABWK01_05990, partial [Infirmifilum sp.]